MGCAEIAYIGWAVTIEFLHATLGPQLPYVDATLAHLGGHVQVCDQHRAPTSWGGECWAGVGPSGGHEHVGSSPGVHRRAHAELPCHASEGREKSSPELPERRQRTTLPFAASRTSVRPASVLAATQRSSGLHARQSALILAPYSGSNAQFATGVPDAPSYTTKSGEPRTAATNSAPPRAHVIDSTTPVQRMLPAST